LGLPGSGARVGGASDTTAPTVPSLGAVADTGGPIGRLQQGVDRPIYTPAAALLPSQSVAPAASADPVSPPAAAQPLEELLPQLGPETAFIGLQDGQVMDALQTRVRVKGPLGAVFDLQVNGQLVPATQVGKKSSLEDKRVTAWEYIGVDLRAGRNTLAVKVTDPFGNVRGQAQITLLAPGPLASVRIQAPERPVADSETPITVRFALRDADGLPVTARTQLTLQAAAGQWQVTDADPHQPGLQVMVEGGTGSFALLPPAQPGKVEITALAGTIKASTAVEFVPKLRPMLAAGLVEGTINLRNLNPASLQPTQSGDVFEREIQSVSRSFDNGKGEVAARAALFLKGKVLGSSLLTLAYDSDKVADARLFRDIQPNQFYPVYGDSSARGFDGQSTGRLYLLLQNGSNYALAGDFATQTDDPARQLTQYARSLNGAKGHWSDGKFSVEAFASRTSATQIVQEFRATGTSGPFQLNANGVVQSEQVHVITRSRDQNALVLKDTALTVFNDYTIEPITGLLLLKAPVSSVDADLNPVFVRVVYDVETGGPKHAVNGVEATVQVVPGVTVGALAVRDEDPANRQQLEGLTLTGKLADKTVVTAEVAHSRTDLQGSGSGQRVELTHEGAGVQAHVWGVRTDAGFYNPGSPQSAGQAQYGAKIGYSLNATNRIVAEALKTSNSTTGAEQTGAELRLEHSLPGNAVLEVGLRHSSSNAQAAVSTTPAVGTDTTATATGITTTASAAAAASGPETSTTSARVKLTVPVPGVAKADAYGVAEQAIDGGGGHEIGVGANYAVNANTKLYVRHDFINSLNGAYTLTSDASRYTSVAGVTTVLPDNTQVFNEYRVADAVDGRTAEAAIGLRKTVQLTTGFNVNGSLQRIKPLSGPSSDDSTALALGAEYTAASNWKASGQVQWQDSSTSRSWLASGAVVNKLDAEWTLLNRLLYNEQINSGAGAGSRELITAQSGVAFRPVDNDKWNALARIQYNRDRDSTVAPAHDVSSWLLSTHVNVQPNSAWIISGRYAAKWLKDAAGDISTSSFTQLLGARSGWDISDHWNVGLQAYGLWGNGSAEAAVGVEVGYLAYKNLWLAAGYNLKGFSAPDLSADAHTQRGAYLRLRFKFDEEALDSHSSRQGADTPAPRVQ
ncbi:MAG: hypothetical protein JWP60_2667, partial [Ramlibacter sp.]|nr:hypothetical protein [Ramlibacter sp.]